MPNQNNAGQLTLTEIFAQLSARLDALEKEVKATRKEAKKTRKAIKSLYHTLTSKDHQNDTQE